jgi:hypothetical protein
MHLTKRWGVICLSVWLILQGLIVFVPRLSFDGLHVLMAALAIVAGVLLLFDR